MPPAVSRPWLVTLRSTTKSAIPTRIRIAPIAGGIAIIGTAPFGRSTGIPLTVASSLESKCTAHRGGDFVQRYGSRSSLHWGAGHRIPGLLSLGGLWSVGVGSATLQEQALYAPCQQFLRSSVREFKSFQTVSWRSSHRPIAPALGNLVCCSPWSASPRRLLLGAVVTLVYSRARG